MLIIFTKLHSIFLVKLIQSFILMMKPQVEPGPTVLYRIEVKISVTLSADSAVS